MNQGYCRLVAKYKQGKFDCYWDSNLDRVQRKRNNQMRDAVNKAGGRSGFGLVWGIDWCPSKVAGAGCRSDRPGQRDVDEKFHSLFIANKKSGLSSFKRKLPPVGATSV